MTLDGTRYRYLSQLTQLYGAAQSATSVNEVKKYCPHLNNVQIQSLMRQASRDLKVSFSAPAVRVEESYHTLQLSSVQEFVQGRRRMRESWCLKYLNFQEKASSDDLFSEEAMAFSKENWGDSLYLDDWKEFQEIRIVNPRTLELKKTIYCVLDRPWKDVVNNSVGKKDQCWGKAIKLFTFNPLEGKELRGKRGVFIEEQCSGCWNGLSQTACKTCKVTFNKLKYASWGLNTPMQIVVFLA